MTPLLRYLRAVLWSFFGIRRGEAARRDVESLRPLPLLATALLLAGLFVLGVLTVARIASTGGL
jgi:hypothetical protein